MRRFDQRLSSVEFVGLRCGRVKKLLVAESDNTLVALIFMQPIPILLITLVAVAALLLLLFTACTKEIREEDLFFPQRTPVMPEESGRIDVEIPIENAQRLRGWYFYNQQNKSTVIYFYGNGETTLSSHGRSKWIAKNLNVNVLSIDYRGYGYSDGSPRINSLLTDAIRVYDAVPDLGSTDQNIIVFGRSIGTAPAIYLTSQRTVQALILEAPFTTISDVISAWNTQLTGLASWIVRLKPEKKLATMQPQPVDLMAEIDVPLLVLHGTTDSIIPMRLGKTIYTVCPSVDKTWCEVTNAGHNNLTLRHPKAASALRTFAEKHVQN